MTLHPILRKCWMKRGKQRRIPAAGQQQLHHVFAAYQYGTDHLIWLDAPTKNTDTFIQLLELLMAAIDPARPVVLVLDNASYHRSVEAQAALAFFEEDGLVSWWLPPYCSDLNLIERFWQHFKGIACANKLFASIPELLDQVRRSLTAQNDPKHPDRFFLKT